VAFRKLKQKKYNSIYGYYNPSSIDKQVLSYYIAYKDAETSKVKKIKAVFDDGRIAITPDEAKEILDMHRRREKKRKEIGRNSNEIEILRKLSNLTLDEMASLFFDNRRTKNNKLDKNAYFNHISDIKINGNRLGSSKLNRLDTQHFLQARDGLVEQKIISNKTTDNLFGVLSAMFNEGMRKKNNWCGFNPIKDKDLAKLTKTDDNARITVFMTDELEKLFAESQYNERLNFFYNLTYYTAARPDAILSLQVKDIDFRQKKVYLKAMKGGKAHSVPATDKMLDLTHKWIESNGLMEGCHYLFYPRKKDQRYPLEERKKKHSRYESLRAPSQKLMDRLFNTDRNGKIIKDRKLRASIYTLRHTAATNLVVEFGIHAVKNYLDHADIRTTEIYAKVNGEQKRLMANTL